MKHVTIDPAFESGIETNHNCSCVCFLILLSLHFGKCFSVHLDPCKTFPLFCQFGFLWSTCTSHMILILLFVNLEIGVNNKSFNLWIPEGERDFFVKLILIKMMDSICFTQIWLKFQINDTNLCKNWIYIDYETLIFVR